jgi:hypothetical protein
MKELLVANRMNIIPEGTSAASIAGITETARNRPPPDTL